MQTNAINCAANTTEDKAESDFATERMWQQPIGSCGVQIGGGPEATEPQVESDPESVNGSAPLPRGIPQEPLKTLFAFAGTLTGLLLTAVSIAIVHDRIPKSPPLPDVSLQVLPNAVWAMTACEILLLVNIGAALLVCLLHKYRCIVLRRILFILSIIFFYRSITIIVTVMPDPHWPNRTLSLAPRSNSSLIDLVKRVARIGIGSGFSMHRMHNLCALCKLGHTASLTVSYLVIRQYAFLKIKTPLRFISLVVCVSSFTFLLLARNHYTVDIVIGYWLASRLWWIFHTLANCPPQQRASLHLAAVWWFPVFSYLEANVPERLPCEIELPWRSGCFQGAYQRLQVRRRMGHFWMRVRGFIN